MWQSWQVLDWVTAHKQLTDFQGIAWWSWSEYHWNVALKPRLGHNFVHTGLSCRPALSSWCVAYITLNFNMWRHVCEKKIASEVAARGDGGVAGEGRVVGVPKFHSWVKCTMLCINEYQFRLDVQHFPWPVYYITLVMLCYKQSNRTPRGS